MKTVRIPSGEQVPALGQGTWRMGENSSKRGDEIASLQRGLDCGLSLIDTAEMYGEGAAEKLVAEAIKGRRDSVFLVSKVYPHNASRRGTVEACERSLHRLNTDRIDLYLLHWRGDIPLAETMDALSSLKQAGKIRHYGVSNFDTADMRELHVLPEGKSVATNQVLYNLSRRGIEHDLLPWCSSHGVPVMAYSPIEQARLLKKAALVAFARRHEISPAHAALGWLLAKDNLIVIPKTGRPERIDENMAALERPLKPEQLAELDSLFPAPPGPRPLEML